MTKVLQEMPNSERKGLVECLVYQSDNLVTCLAFPALGEQIIRILIGLLPLLDEKDLLAVIEQCRPDRTDFWPILWPLLTLQDQEEGSDFGLLLINFYVTVQLLAMKKASNCDVNLVKRILMQGQIRPPCTTLSPLGKCNRYACTYLCYVDTADFYFIVRMQIDFWGLF